MDSIDRLLAGLGEQEKPGAEVRSLPGCEAVAGRSLDQLLDQLGGARRRWVREQLSRKYGPSALGTVEDLGESDRQSSALLHQLRRQYEQRDQAVAERQAQWEAEQCLQVEAEAAGRRRQLEQWALEWLSQVDVTSEEGLWFEEFAFLFGSRLEAAMEYLEVLGRQQSPLPRPLS